MSGLGWLRGLGLAACVTLPSCNDQPTLSGPLQVTRLTDQWKDIETVEGAVTDFVPAQTLRFEALEPVVFGDWSVLELPWPAIKESLQVQAGGRDLPHRRSPEMVASARGYFFLPRVFPMAAARAEEIQGVRQRRRAAPPSPEHIQLVKDGDFLEASVMFPAESTHLHLLTKRGPGPASLEISVDGTNAVSIESESKEWHTLKIPLTATAGSHRVRVTARKGKTDSQGKFLVAVASLDFHHPGGDRLLISRNLKTVDLQYVAQTPETRMSWEGGDQRQLLSVGGAMTLQVEGGGRPTLGELVPDNPSNPWQFAHVPAGLHPLKVEGNATSITAHHPAAGLIPQLIVPTLRLRDHPDEDGDRSGAPVPSETLDRVLARMELLEDRRPGFWLPSPSRLEIKTELRPGAQLAFAIGIPETPPQTVEDEFSLSDPEAEDESLDSQPVGFRVTWIRDGQETVLDEVDEVFPGDPWTERRIEAPENAGDGVLRWETFGASGIPAGFADPRILRQATEPENYNIILYVIDTLRADHLSCYGAQRETSPFLDSLAADGFLFENTYAVASWTRPSTVSVLTGILPSYHGANGGGALPSNAVTLAETLRLNGYSTWGYAANVQVSARGVKCDQGFHRFLTELGFRRLAKDTRDSSSGQINQAFFPWVEENGGEPFFAYLHSLDPHSPYAPPRANLPFGKSYRGRLKGEPLIPRENLRPMTNELEIEDVEYVMDVYDNEIVYQDRQIRALVEHLQKLGLWSRTILLVVSDHGEEFLDHGDWDHSGRMWEEQVRVPGILHLPESLRAELAVTPHRIKDPISQIDVAPSLLALVGIEDAYPRQGRSVMPLLRQNSDEEWVSYCEEPRGRGEADDLGALRRGEYKLIWEHDPAKDETKYRLFHLPSDPGEQIDLATKKPDVLEAMLRWRDRYRKDVQGFHGELRRLGLPPLDKLERVHYDASQLQQLEALGYVGGEDR